MMVTLKPIPDWYMGQEEAYNDEADECDKLPLAPREDRFFRALNRFKSEREYRVRKAKEKAAWPPAGSVIASHPIYKFQFFVDQVKKLNYIELGNRYYAKDVGGYHWHKVYLRYHPDNADLFLVITYFGNSDENDSV